MKLKGKAQRETFGSSLKIAGTARDNVFVKRVEYKVGTYEIQPNTGLTQLDKKVTGLIRKQRQERERK